MNDEGVFTRITPNITDPDLRSEEPRRQVEVNADEPVNRGVMDKVKENRMYVVIIVLVILIIGIVAYFVLKGDRFNILGGSAEPPNPNQPPNNQIANQHPQQHAHAAQNVQQRAVEHPQQHVPKQVKLDHHKKILEEHSLEQLEGMLDAEEDNEHMTNTPEYIPTDDDPEVHGAAEVIDAEEYAEDSENGGHDEFDAIANEKFGDDAYSEISKISLIEEPQDIMPAECGIPLIKGGNCTAPGKFNGRCGKHRSK